MPKFKIVLAIEVEANDYSDALVLATYMAERANDSADGEVGEIVERTVEEL